MTAFLDLCCSRKELPLWGLDLTYNDMSVSRLWRQYSVFSELGAWRAGISWIWLAFDFGFAATCWAHLVQSRPFYSSITFDNKWAVRSFSQSLCIFVREYCVNFLTNRVSTITGLKVKAVQQFRAAVGRLSETFSREDSWQWERCFTAGCG